MFLVLTLQQGRTYGDLFIYALRNFGILCIGLYRFRDTSESVQSPSSKRYVITNPPENFPLLPTDQVRHEKCVLFVLSWSFHRWAMYIKTPWPSFFFKYFFLLIVQRLRVRLNIS